MWVFRQNALNGDDHRADDISTLDYRRGPRIQVNLIISSFTGIAPRGAVINDSIKAINDPKQAEGSGSCRTGEPHLIARSPILHTGPTNCPTRIHQGFDYLIGFDQLDNRGARAGWGIRRSNGDPPVGPRPGRLINSFED